MGNIRHGGFFDLPNLAWMSIENELFIWNKNRGAHEIIVYADTHVITSCGCIRPKTGFFNTNIQYLITVSTQFKLALLALSRRNLDLSNNIIKIAETNIQFDKIRCVSTNGSNRILLGGQSGSLYEIIYEKWLLRKNM